MTFPASEWGEHDFDEIFPPEKYRTPDGEEHDQPHGWRLLSSRQADLKNLGTIELQQIVNAAAWLPSQSAEDRARETVAAISHAGRRWQRET